MSCRASVALVVSRVTIGLLVMIALTGVVLGSSPSAVTYNADDQQHRTNFCPIKRTRNARSFAVNMPLRPSSSSTTSTQSLRLAAHSWLASDTVIDSGTVSAGLGRSAATVPLAAAFPLRGRGTLVDIVRLSESLPSSFFLSCCSRVSKCLIQSVMDQLRRAESPFYVCRTCWLQRDCLPLK